MRMKKFRRVIQPGDHVVAQRRRWHSDMETHHAIYIGNGRVIQLDGGGIRDRSLKYFHEGGDVWIKHHRRKRRFDRAEVMARAMRNLGPHHYCLACCNCQHFATWCVEGRVFSKQVDNWSWLRRFGFNGHSDLEFKP
jgi:hypothetical protein